MRVVVIFLLITLFLVKKCDMLPVDNFGSIKKEL